MTYLLFSYLLHAESFAAKTMDQQTDFYKCKLIEYQLTGNTNVEEKCRQFEDKTEHVSDQFQFWWQFEKETFVLPFEYIQIFADLKYSTMKKW